MWSQHPASEQHAIGSRISHWNRGLRELFMVLRENASKQNDFGGLSSYLPSVFRVDIRCVVDLIPLYLEAASSSAPEATTNAAAREITAA